MCNVWQGDFPDTDLGEDGYLENQADRVGMEYMTEAGYDARQAPRLWKVMTQQLGDRHTDFFWSNHDNNTTRRSYLMAELKNNYSDVKFDDLKVDSEEFRTVKSLVAGGESTNKHLKMRLRKPTSATGGVVTQAKVPLSLEAPSPTVAIHVASTVQFHERPTTQIPEPPATQAPPPATAPQVLVNGLAEVPFTSNPPGALVSFSGMRVCYTPCVIKLEPRQFRVTMTLVGYAEWTREITVEAGKPIVAELLDSPHHEGPCSINPH
jgi:hypothetical protein